MLPAFPLDGGRVTRALLWWRMHDRDRATAVAAAVGRMFGFAFIVLGVLATASGAFGGLWLALIGGFLVLAAGAEAQQAEARRTFGDCRVAQLMTRDPVVVEATLPLQDAVEVFGAALHPAFPVVDAAGHAVGLLTIDDVRRIPVYDRRLRRVADVAELDPGVLVDPQDRIVDVLPRRMFVTLGRAVVTGPAGEVAGVLSMTDVQRALRAASLRTTPHDASVTGRAH